MNVPLRLFVENSMTEDLRQMNSAEEILDEKYNLIYCLCVL